MTPSWCLIGFSTFAWAWATLRAILSFSTTSRSTRQQQQQQQQQTKKQEARAMNKD
jgi:hypothetical protein